MRFKPNKYSGFSLIELMIALAVLSITISLVAPSYHDATVRRQLSSTAIDLMSALNYSRSEAVRLGKYVVFCNSPSGTDCATQANWGQGWMSFVDDNKNDSLDSDEQILRSWKAIPRNYSLVSATSQLDFLRYSPLGDLNNLGNAETFVLCYQEQLVGAKTILINRLRPRMGVDSDSDGVPEEVVNANAVNITSCT